MHPTLEMVEISLKQKTHFLSKKNDKKHPQEPPDPPKIIGLGGFLVFFRRKLDAQVFLPSTHSRISEKNDKLNFFRDLQELTVAQSLICFW